MPDSPFLRLQPRASRGRDSWALVNLICLLLTVYTFVPLHRLRSKYHRRKLIKDLAEADPYHYDLKKFTRHYRIGIGTELIDSVLAVIAFILTEDIRLPMVLIDRWTPLMALIFVICWALDVRLFRYRGGCAAAYPSVPFPWIP